MHGGGLTTAGLHRRANGEDFPRRRRGLNPLGEFAGQQGGRTVTPSHRAERCPILNARRAIEYRTGAPFCRDHGAAELLRLSLCHEGKHTGKVAMQRPVVVLTHTLPAFKSSPPHSETCRHTDGGGFQRPTPSLHTQTAHSV